MRAGTLFLLILVLGLGAYIAAIERKADSTDRRREIARRVLRIDASRITGIRVAQPAMQFAAVKEDDLWRLTSPVAARADAGAIARLLDTLELLERSDVIRGREQRRQGLTLASFGLDQPRARITLNGADKDWVLLVGRDTPAGGNLFLKEANDSAVFVASTNLLADLPISVDALRDRRVFLGFPGTVSRIDLRRREGLLTLARTELGSWRLQQPWSGRAAQTEVQNLLDQLFTARAVDFVAESFDAASLYGLDEPAAQVAVTGDRQRGDQVLLLGKVVERGTNQVYATLQGEGTVFTVSQSLLDALQVKAESLRDRRLLALPAHDIAHLRIEEDERTLLLSRAEGGWDIEIPLRIKANEARVQAAIAEWTGLRIETFINPSGTNLATWGFDSPARRITFARRPPTAGTNVTRVVATDDELTILVSSLPPSNGLATVKWAHEDTVLLIRASALDALPASTRHFRHPEVLAVDPGAVRSLTVSRGGVEESVLRDAADAVFRAAPPGVAVDADAVRRVLENLSSLRATAFVAAALDLAPYELDKPRAQLTVGIQGGTAPVRTLLFGREDENGQVLTMLRGGDVVFTISRETRDKLLAPLYKPEKSTKEPPVVATPNALSEEPAR
ncbi:MAG TPA: DUF4340 domain-containing protein [Kiritimatiellia bacterium]|nr:DUF4340 domain-containing protein [Kiritimatiellia bacterium]